MINLSAVAENRRNRTAGYVACPRSSWMRLAGSLYPVRHRQKVRAGAQRMVMAVPVSVQSLCAHPFSRRAATTSPASFGRTTRGKISCPGCRDTKAGNLSYLSTLFRHSSARCGLRHSHGAGVARPCERANNHGVHTCAQTGWPRRAQPVRFNVGRPRVP